MQIYWASHPEPKATTADIARIEAEIGSTLPVSYIEFVTRIGFVIFGEDAEERNHFDYTITFPDRQEIREGDISFLEEPDRLITGYRVLTTSEIEDDEQFPKFPANYLPIGNSAGQDQILLEMGEHAGRVWFWPYNDWAWGTEDNTRLGFVAEDFYEFINKLRP